MEHSKTMLFIGLNFLFAIASAIVVTLFPETRVTDCVIIHVGFAIFLGAFLLWKAERSESKARKDLNDALNSGRLHQSR